VCGKIAADSNGVRLGLSHSFKHLAQLYQKIKYYSVELENVVLSLIKAVTPKKRDSHESTADISDSDLAACLDESEIDVKQKFNIREATDFTLIYASHGRSAKTLIKLYKIIGIHNGSLPNLNKTIS